MTSSFEEKIAKLKTALENVFLKKTDVKDNLTSTDTNKPLSAKQGKELKTLVDGKALSNHTHGNIQNDGVLKINGTAQTYKNVCTDANGNIIVESKNNHTHPDTQITYNGSTKNSVSPIDLAVYNEFNANRLAFLKKENIIVEYTTNGTATTPTWTAFPSSRDNDKVKLVTTSTTFWAGNKSNATDNASAANQVRVTLDAGGVYNSSNSDIYMNTRKILVYFGSGGGTNCKCKVEYSLYDTPTTWVTTGTYDVDGWSGWNSIPFNPSIGWGGYSNQLTTKIRYIRLTFYNSSAKNVSISKIRMIGETCYTPSSSSNSMASEGHMYTYDIDKNVTFPAKIIKSGGTTSQFLKANGDVDSNVYIHTAGTNLSKSNNTLNHATSGVGAKSSGLYKTTIDAQGHITSATAVEKADITGLGIPAQDTTYTPASATPLREDYTGSVGTSTKYAREDHKHPIFDYVDAGTAGTAGYVKAVQIKINTTYQDSPIVFKIIQRSSTERAIVQVRFNNANSNDPTLNSITHTGFNNDYYLRKESTSTWSLIVKKAGSEAHDSIKIIVENPNGGIAISNIDSQLNSLPSSTDSNPLTKSTYIGFTSAEKTKLAGIATSANNYSHPTYTAQTSSASVPTGNQTPAFNATFNVPQVVTDGTGHVTAINTKTVKIPALPTANTSTAGIVKLGTASGTAAEGNHTHSSYVNPTIADNLTTNNASQVLSAKQGYILNNQDAEYVEGTHGTTATGSWTGTCTKLRTIQKDSVILFKMTSAGSGNASLTLTLADGSTFGPKDVYYNATTRFTTHLPINTILNLVYDGTKWINTGIQNTNNYDRTYACTKVKNGENGQLNAYTLIYGKNDGKHYKLASGGVLDVRFQILYNNANIAKDGVSYNVYTFLSGVNIQNTISEITRVANEALYIEGSAFTDGQFTITSNVLVSESSVASGKYYIPIGAMENTTSLRFTGGIPKVFYHNGTKLVPVEDSKYATTSHTHSYVPTSAIKNDLTTGGATNVLSAEQGKTLQTNKLNKNADDTSTGYITAKGFKVSNSSGFLKADGSVDSSTYNNYSHPTNLTALSSGLYKITTNNNGHVTAGTAVAKADITGLGIPGSDTHNAVEQGTRINIGEAVAAGALVGKVYGDSNGYYKKLASGLNIDTSYPIFYMPTATTGATNGYQYPYHLKIGVNIQTTAGTSKTITQNKQVFVEGTALDKNKFTVSSNIFVSEGAFTTGNYYINIGGSAGSTTNMNFNSIDSRVFKATSATNLVPVESALYATSGHNHSGTYVDGAGTKNSTNGSAIAEIKANTTVKGTIYHPRAYSDNNGVSSGLYKIAVNKDGHVTSTASVGASDLPSHTHSYAASSHAHGNVLNDGTMTTADASTIFDNFVGINGSNKLIKANKFSNASVYDTNSATYTNIGSLSSGASQQVINNAINTALGISSYKHTLNNTGTNSIFNLTTSYIQFYKIGKLVIAYFRVKTSTNIQTSYVQFTGMNGNNLIPSEYRPTVETISLNFCHFNTDIPRILTTRVNTDGSVDMRGNTATSAVDNYYTMIWVTD